MTSRWHSRRAEVPERDQAPSSFTEILERLCAATSGLGAALVDREGETVDYAGPVEPFEIKVAAAEWRLILQYFGECRSEYWARTHEVIVRCAARTFAIAALSDGYAVVLELPRHSFNYSERAMAVAIEELSDEAGLEQPDVAEGGERWRRARVRASARGKRGSTFPEPKPLALWRGEAWQELTVLGRYADPSGTQRDSGFRVRLDDGAELTLVREPLDRWYVDEGT